MDEYFIVHKRMMESRTAQLQINKELPEALEVLSLDKLTSRVFRRNDISDWEKASLLTSTLERFLALKPKAFNEPAIALGPLAEEFITKKVPEDPVNIEAELKPDVIRRWAGCQKYFTRLKDRQKQHRERGSKPEQGNASGLCCRMNPWLPSVLRFVACSK